MNTGQRIALVVVAIVVLVGGFVLAQGAGDEDGDTEQTQTAAQTTAGDGTETAEGTGGEQAPPATQTQEAPPPPRVESIRIRDNQLASGEPRTLRFEDGETIRLRFTSNVQAEVHIHGYDEYVQVPAGGTGRARFKADAQGVFEVEDHATGALLAKLEVRP